MCTYRKPDKSMFLFLDFCPIIAWAIYTFYLQLNRKSQVVSRTSEHRLSCNRCLINYFVNMIPPLMSDMANVIYVLLGLTWVSQLITLPISLNLSKHNLPNIPNINQFYSTSIAVTYRLIMLRKQFVRWCHFVFKLDCPPELGVCHYMPNCFSFLVLSLCKL